MEKIVEWLSPLEEYDDFGSQYKGVMYDAKTNRGPWACMSEESWKIHGTGQLGLGHGQKYELQPDNKWLKVEG